MVSIYLFRLLVPNSQVGREVHSNSDIFFSQCELSSKLPTEMNEDAMAQDGTRHTPIIIIIICTS